MRCANSEDALLGRVSILLLIDAAVEIKVHEVLMSYVCVSAVIGVVAEVLLLLF